VASGDTPALRPTLYGVGLVQLTETLVSALKAPPLKVPKPMGDAVARQVAWTITDTPNAVVAVAAMAGLAARASARQPNANDADLGNIAPLLRRRTPQESLIGSHSRNLRLLEELRLDNTS
jgi:hypothetical protein